MKTILSFGAGVNSTSIIALVLLKEIPMPDYILFSDTGAEYPHTYKYMDYLESKGIRITYITGGLKGMTLIEFCQKTNQIPSKFNRWCTGYWKRDIIYYFARSLGEEFKIILGIDAGEVHRAEKRRRVYYEFPLIDMGINRNECKKIIKKAGLGVPLKSGCFICPYQRKKEFVYLKKNYPNLWKILVDLEKNSKGFTYIQGMTIDEYVSDLHKQEELDFGLVLDQKCECYFN